MSIAPARLRATALFALAAACLGSAASAQPAPVLAGLEPGLWEVRAEGREPRNMCVAEGAALVQLQHRGSPCSQLVISRGGDDATVHYSCAAAGWGRTSIRLSTPRSVRIDTQGIAGNAPFQYTAVARKTGDCPVRAAALVR